MKRWLLAILLAGFMLSAGCRRDGSLELLQMENFQLCEQITQLELQLHDRQTELEACQRKLEEAEESRERDRSGDAQRSSSSVLRPPKVELPEDQGEPGPAPKFDSPTPANKESRLRRDIRAMRASFGGDRRVTTITVDPVETRGLDLDAGPGDEGLTVVIEPRNAAGEPVPTPGEVTIAAWDDTLLGAVRDNPFKREQAHVALWRFNATQADEAFELSESGPRLRFDLRWPGPRPRVASLRLYVRFLTSDGRELRTELPVRIALSGSRQRGLAAAQPARTDDAQSGPQGAVRPVHQYQRLPRPPADADPAEEEVAAAPPEDPADSLGDRTVASRGRNVAEQTSASSERELSGQLPDRSPRRRPEWKPYR
jgi:hypothetical protein